MGEGSNIVAASRGRGLAVAMEGQMSICQQEERVGGRSFSLVQHHEVIRPTPHCMREEDCVVIGSTPSSIQETERSMSMQVVAGGVLEGEGVGCQLELEIGVASEDPRTSHLRVALEVER